jgi:hypothetical protein
MSRFRYSPHFITIALAAMFVIPEIARAQQSSSPAQIPAPAAAPQSTAAAKPALPAPKSDKDAEKSLDQSIAELDPKKHPWVEFTLWEKADVQGLITTGEGHYLAGPDHRLKMDLTVRLANEQSELRTISDGKTVWNWVRSGHDEPRATQYDLTKVQALLNVPGTLPQFSEDFYKNQSFTGLLPLLQNLRRQMTFTKQEKESWNGHNVLKLTGEWTPDYAKAMTLQNNIWAPLQPRICRLYLDAQTHWPYRLEWWGPAAVRAPDTLLMELEFRNPHLFSAAQQAPVQAFRFDPGNAEVRDVTEQYLQQLGTARAQAGTQRSSPPATGSTPSR